MSFNAPQPSPDGKKIYVVGEQPRSELVRYDTKSRQFVPYLSGVSVTEASFSRDGAWVAYVTYPEGALWRSRLDGSQKLQLTDASDQFADLPQWSPDGQQIVFVSGNGRQLNRLFVVPADGGTPRPITSGEKTANAPSWKSVDTITFTESQSTTVGGALKLLNLNTLQISDEVPKTKDLFVPMASPNGRYIGSSTVDGQSILLFDFTTKKWQELIRTSAGSLAWSRDSQYLYFDSGLGENAGLYRIRIVDRKLERVADLKGFRRVVFGWLPWSGVTPDGDPILPRDLSSQEVYALDFEEP